MKRQILRTVQQKLLAVLLLTTFVALLVALGLIVSYNLRAYQQNLIADMSTQSELLGHMTAPALSFDDKQLALQNLSLLRIQPKVRAAAIYNARGGLFASYAATGDTSPLPTIPETDTIRIEGNNLLLFKRIVNDGEILGTVYLLADYDLIGRMADYLGIAAAVMIVAMLIAFFMSTRLQKIVTGPILAIAEIAREVVEQRDYSRRAEKISDDEVGVLVGSFNDMLAEIERRTQELENSNREIAHEVEERTHAQQEVMRLNADLEDRVLERTAQLESANAEMLLAKAAAENANHAKSAFLSSMSHELRTPLNAILGFAQLLSLEALPSTLAQRKDFTNYILKAGRHLLTLINEVLDLAKVESGTLLLSLEPVSLAEIMQEAQDMVTPLANARNIRMMFPQNAPFYVIADRTRLKQVLINLLSNAIKYNREGGSIIVGCTSITHERIHIVVQDTGAGLNSEQVAQLFQPFNRLGQETGVEEGTGIGLVVTKKLVELMGGEIGVTSSAGIGSVFWIELETSSAPQYANQAQLIERSPEIIQQYASHIDGANERRKLLYVEDNPANLKLIEELLSFRSDLWLLTAANGNLGVELARAHLPDVILMDINLPGMNGNDAMVILRDDPKTAHIPVIALTANAMPREIEKGIALGFFRYLTKPINIDEFLIALDSALDLAKASLPKPV